MNGKQPAAVDRVIKVRVRVEVQTPGAFRACEAERVATGRDGMSADVQGALLDAVCGALGPGGGGAIIEGLAARVVAQSELLSRKAEKEAGI